VPIKLSINYGLHIIIKTAKINNNKNSNNKTSSIKNVSIIVLHTGELQ